ncbi:PAS domain-containing protein [Coleofasciculus sp. LEGE 07092]|nr:PAS domain-containing protein [Coleofasciculus sp. LEGE 07081]MBE9148468.1 PAS domain-containing protein [Coleofasciculus sp. LEGE 07092]
MPFLIQLVWLVGLSGWLSLQDGQWEQLDTSTYNTILLCLAVLGWVAVVGIFTSGWISQPIRRLSAVSQDLAQQAWTGDFASGEFDQVHVEGISELEILAQSFNKMAGQLRESFTVLAKTNEELERRVERRTVELRRAEAELRVLFEAMTELIFVKDSQGRYLKIVSANAPPLYQPVEELLGKTDYDIFERSQADTFVGYIQQALKTQQTIQVEYSLPVGDREAWFSTRISPISADSVLWVARDITDRKQALEALRTREAQYRDLVETPNCIILRWNALGQIKFINSYGQNFFGYQEDQILGCNIVGTIIPETERSRRILKVLIQDIRKHPDRYQFKETKNICRNGKTVWVNWTNKPILDDWGQLVEVLSIGTDATERKRAEEALREKEQYLRLVLDNIPQQVFWKDTNLVFLGCNKNWAKAAQIESPESVVGKTDYDLLTSPEIAELYRAQDRRVIEQNQAEFHVVETKQKPPVDGHTVWLDVSKIPIHDAQGKVIGILGVLEDITQRRQAEEALRIEQEKSERLLLNILPAAIAQQLKQSHSSLEKSNGEALIAEQFEDVTILFADIVGFTPLASRMLPTELVNLLGSIVSTFDRLSEQYSLEKIKTIGDAYMVACGLPVHRADHAEAIAQMALDMQRVITQFRTDRGEPFQIRIGINTGPVVAGVIGMKKFIYDLWGDTVNVASRMESQGIPGGIQVTKATYERLKDKYVLEKRGEIMVKGKGEMMTYWLTGRLDE